MSFVFTTFITYYHKTWLYTIDCVHVFIRQTSTYLISPTILFIIYLSLFAVSEELIDKLLLRRFLKIDYNALLKDEMLHHVHIFWVFVFTCEELLCIYALWLFCIHRMNIKLISMLSCHQIIVAS